MFTLFVFIISALSGFLAYRFAENYLEKRSTLTYRQELVTKLVFAGAGAFIGMLLGSLLYVLLKVAISLIIFVGMVALVTFTIVYVARFANKVSKPKE